MDEHELQQPETPPPVHAGSPFDEERQEPRLSIMHLLVWTACVAVWFSFVRVVDRGVPGLFFGHSNLSLLLFGLGFGTILAGLVALVSRRLRGVSLVRDPGDYLLLSSSTNLVFSIVSLVLISLLIVSDFFQYSPTGLLILSVYSGLRVANISVLLTGAVRATSRRWRVFFLVGAFESVFYLAIVLQADIFRVRSMTGHVVSHIVLLLVTATLLVVVAVDSSERERYPWQHWLGITVWLWLNTIRLGSFVNYGLLRHWSP